jgi:hypothetical protein
MAEFQRNRRRNLVVDKPAQGRLIYAISLLPALGLSGLMLLVAYFCHQLSLEVMTADIELVNVVPLYLSVAGFVTLAGVFLFYNTVKLSHRIAGPSYRLCESMKRIREGDLDFRVQLRDGDHLGELGAELNRLLDYLNENPPAGALTRARQEPRQEPEPQPERLRDASEATAGRDG